MKLHEAFKQRAAAWLLEKEADFGPIVADEIQTINNTWKEVFDALLAERDKYKAALIKIAKPAIGGKQQQYDAQEALK
jgi:hypothetical protein